MSPQRFSGSIYQWRAQLHQFEYGKRELFGQDKYDERKYREAAAIELINAQLPFGILKKSASFCNLFAEVGFLFLW